MACQERIHFHVSPERFSWGASDAAVHGTETCVPTFAGNNQSRPCDRFRRILADDTPV